MNVSGAVQGNIEYYTRIYRDRGLVLGFPILCFRSLLVDHHVAFSLARDVRSFLSGCVEFRLEDCQF